jgi:phosphopantetheinyl transferase (holo-ACP synthase)
MFTPELIVGVVTAIGAGAGLQAVRSLFKDVRTRVKGDQRREAAKAEIANILSAEGYTDSAKERVIKALDNTSDAVVVVGDVAIIKDSATGTPTVVVRELSSDQREKIKDNQAPMKNATLFHAWLDDTRRSKGAA